MSWSNSKKAAYQREWRKANPQKWKEVCQKSNRLHNLRLYGIEHDDYDRMFAEQEGRCAICGRHQCEFKRRLAIDHDHATNVVRALLCPACNAALGGLQDDPRLLRLAADYIEAFR